MFCLFVCLFVCFPFSLKERERQHQEDLDVKEAEIERYRKRFVRSITKIVFKVLACAVGLVEFSRGAMQKKKKKKKNTNSRHFFVEVEVPFENYRTG